MRRLAYTAARSACGIALTVAAAGLGLAGMLADGEGARIASWLKSEALRAMRGGR